MIMLSSGGRCGPPLRRGSVGLCASIAFAPGAVCGGHGRAPWGRSAL